MNHFAAAEKSEHLSQLLRMVYENKYSAFYRTHFGFDWQGGEHITEDVWHALPLLSRAQIMQVPFWDRVFVPREEVPFTRNTYGTTGNRILITARSVSGDYSNPYRELGIKRLMTFFASGYHEFPRSAIPELQQWFGDVSNLALSAEIATQARIDSLYITPYTALLFGPLLKTRGYNTEIRAVQLTGERCSPLQLETLHALYPGATVYGHYASSETREGVAVACAHERAKGVSLIMEAMPGNYCELVIPETGDPVTEPGVHGELVVTTTRPDIPFPLIRYRTGDIAVYTPRTCECEKTRPGFEVLGRSTVFPVRLAKGELTVDAVERALHVFPALHADYFEIHYVEEKSKDTVLPRVTIGLVASAAAVPSPEEFSKALKVFPTFTYADGVSQGLYLPLSFTVIERPTASPTGKGKPPIVVRHVSGTDSIFTSSVHDAR